MARKKEEKKRRDINKDGRADVRITGIAPSNQNRTRIIRGPGGLFKGRMVAKNGGDPTRTLLVKSATKLPGANYIKKREDKKTLNEFLGKRVNLIGGREVLLHFLLKV